MTSLRALFAVSALAAASPGFAADGVVEINQACASGPGCFASDLPGFPVRINGSAGRSYRLTSDLVVTAPNANALELAASLPGFSIDLGGFAIRGPGTCSGSPLVCNGTITGSGIAVVTGAAVSAISVRNGAIVGMGAGLRLSPAADCTVEDVIVRENGSSGVTVGPMARVRNVSAIQNLGSGILAGDGSIVASSVVRGNGGAGVSVGGGAVVVGNSVNANAGDGIAGGGVSALIAGNSVVQNGRTGIFADNGSLVLGNAIEENGQSAGSHFGIVCGQGCRSHQNGVRENVGTGLSGFFESSYSENVFTGNSVAAVSAGPIARGANLCAGPGVGSVSCP